MRPINLNPLALALSCIGLLHAHQIQADTVRLADGFRDIAGSQLREFDTVGAVMARESVAVQAYVKDAATCRDLLSIPYGHEHGYDRTRNTHNIIFGRKVGCWALASLDPDRPVGATLPADHLTPDIIRDIMVHLNQLADRSEDWRKTLLVFHGSSVRCRDDEECAAFWPEGSDLSDYEVSFRLILADGNDRAIKVAQSYDGRVDWVFGVRWRKTATGGEVVDIFPDLD
jgi:hypothetical protein